MTFMTRVMAVIITLACSVTLFIGLFVGHYFGTTRTFFPVLSLGWNETDKNWQKIRVNKDGYVQCETTELKLKHK